MQFFQILFKKRMDSSICFYMCKLIEKGTSHIYDILNFFDDI